MESVVLVIHLILATAIIGLVLLQRSEGGGLGIGGSQGGGLGGLATAKGTANALTKMTGLCAAGFFITSLTLGVLATQQNKNAQGILENIEAKQEISIEQAPIDDISAPVDGITFVPPSEMPELPPANTLKSAETPTSPTSPEVPLAPAE